jgi:hypothetical protein
MPGRHVHITVNVLTKHSEPMLYGYDNGESDLITKS